MGRAQGLSERHDLFSAILGERRGLATYQLDTSTLEDKPFSFPEEMSADDQVHIIKLVKWLHDNVNQASYNEVGYIATNSELYESWDAEENIDGCQEDLDFLVANRICSTFSVKPLYMINDPFFWPPEFMAAHNDWRSSVGLQPYKHQEPLK